MWRSVACDALRKGKRLELRYDHFLRVVEVHTVGVTTAGNEAMSVYQVRGGSDSNERVGWKTMRLDEAFTAAVINEESEAPRAGYKRGAKIFSQIYCQI
ncbi:MAG: hypothetical protein E5X68_25480 [Mesorhizobium sp.]|nr:MAG: hypothetical protein EOQ84_27155 [Mesorhizobium sp.]RWL23558.1 MAG: hypothetical protein EOR58_25970 [Mesorhizobium sp.]RWL25546.1 MAG: hypothetical protein EOR63_27655 [Mesorhizobium sp.]RWL33745.1 MAG: hypothetical protein EOR59_24845 [Mesorhizobium sp.]RWL47868.1 MAG: hypothetical protein EOR62_27580 [Mesorhizobium sp.]